MKRKPKAKLLPDGMRQAADYPIEITVNLSAKQHAFLREHFGWLGHDSHVAYFLIISELTDRLYPRRQRP